MKPGIVAVKDATRSPVLAELLRNLDEAPSVDDFFAGLVRDNMVTLTRATQCGGRLSVQDCEHMSVTMANIGHAAEAMDYPVAKATSLPEVGESAAPRLCARIAAKLAPAEALIRDMVCLAETGAICSDAPVHLRTDRAAPRKRPFFNHEGDQSCTYRHRSQPRQSIPPSPR